MLVHWGICAMCGNHRLISFPSCRLISPFNNDATSIVTLVVELDFLSLFLVDCVRERGRYWLNVDFYLYRVVTCYCWFRPLLCRALALPLATSKQLLLFHISPRLYSSRKETWKEVNIRDFFLVGTESQQKKWKISIAKNKTNKEERKVILKGSPSKPSRLREP